MMSKRHIKLGKKAVFFDRDGTLIVDKHYLADPTGVILLPGVSEGLKVLRNAGYRLYIVTNQSGIARGYFSIADLYQVHDKLIEVLQLHGVEIDDWEFCPHHLQGIIKSYQVRCDCRKPEAGMIFKLANRHQIDLANSYMVGDRETDVLAGKRAGCKTILFHTDKPDETEADTVCRSFREVVQVILRGV